MLMFPGEIRFLCILGMVQDVRRAALFCREACEGLFPDSALPGIELAVTEACNNIIEHAYHFSTDRRIWISVFRERDRVVFRIEDEAEHFYSPSLVRPPPETGSCSGSALEAVPERGRGVYLIHAVMDEVRYVRIGNRNRLDMCRFLPPEFHERPTVHQAPDLAGTWGGAGDREELERRLHASESAVTEMAEELATAYESLELFYSLSHDVNALLDEDSVLQTVLQRARASIGAHWGVIRCLHQGKLEVRATAGEPPPAMLGAGGAPTPIEREGVEQGTERTFFMEDGTPVLCFPIAGRTEVLGSFMLGGAEHPTGFLAPELKLARALADHVGINLENRRLYDKNLRARLAQHELEIAHELQRNFYPVNLPRVPGLILESRIETARQVGGDYLGFAPRESRLDFLLADAMGKGMNAAFFSVLAHMAFRSIVDLRAPLSPAEALKTLHKLIYPDLDRFGVYMTAMYGVVDARNAVFHYASAGHCAPILIAPGGEVRLLETREFMLGIRPEIRFTNFQASFPPGAKLLCYTDGLTDITDGDDNMLGIEPVLDLCRRNAHQPVKRLCGLLLGYALEQTPSGGLQDDVVVIGFEHAATAALPPRRQFQGQGSERAVR